jgi:YidC/Oxa1 family membrane protein insertase
MWEAIIIKPFINTLLLIYNVIGGNFGVAIILFTILIRLITHPLMVKQIKGAQAMQELQKNPEWLQIQEKYKGDKEKLAQEQMRLYKELGINPFASCLPTLIQFPIIIGLYQAVIAALASTPVDLLNLMRNIYPGLLDVAKLIPLNARFLWMDLGQPERLYIPGLDWGIPVLVVVVVITTYVQSKLIATPSTGGRDQGAAMANMMNLYMPVFMGYLAYTLASGLALYFIASNLIGILQYAMLGKVNWSNVIPWAKKPETSPTIKSAAKPAVKPAGNPGPKSSSKPTARPPMKSVNKSGSKSKK